MAEKATQCQLQPALRVARSGGDALLTTGAGPAGLADRASASHSSTSVQPACPHGSPARHTRGDGVPLAAQRRPAAAPKPRWRSSSQQCAAAAAVVPVGGRHRWAAAAGWWAVDSAGSCRWEFCTPGRTWIGRTANVLCSDSQLHPAFACSCGLPHHPSSRAPHSAAAAMAAAARQQPRRSEASYPAPRQTWMRSSCCTA